MCSMASTSSSGAPDSGSGSRTRADGARAIARRSRGTPRIANRLLRRVRDFLEVKREGQSHIDEAVAQAVTFAKRQGVGAWFCDETFDFVLLNDSRVVESV